MLYFHNSIIPFDKKNVEGLIQEISTYVTSEYGIVYQRDFSKGPGLYVGDIIAGLEFSTAEEEEADRIGEWWRAYFLGGNYRLGLLRDIYPMNLLSEAHLREPVLGTTLKDWIESSPQYGELKALTPNLWSWSLSAEEIDQVREALRPTGLLICI